MFKTGTGLYLKHLDQGSYIEIRKKEYLKLKINKKF